MQVPYSHIHSRAASIDLVYLKRNDFIRWEVKEVDKHNKYTIDVPPKNGESNNSRSRSNDNNVVKSSRTSGSSDSGSGGGAIKHRYMYRATKLGMATLSSSLSPSEGMH